MPLLKSLVSGGASLLPALVLMAAAAAPAAFVAHNNGYASARKEVREDRRVFVAREAILWTMLDDSYAGREALSDQFDYILQAGQDAQDAWRRDLVTYRRDLQAARDSTRRALDLLDELKDPEHETWADTHLPSSTRCVFNDADCDTAAARAYREGDLDVREPEFPGGGE